MAKTVDEWYPSWPGTKNPLVDWDPTQDYNKCSWVQIPQLA
jgi:hypothetical protein